MHTAVGYPVLIRGFRLALSVEGLRPHTVDNYVRDVQRFAEYHKDPLSASPSDVRAFDAACREFRADTYEEGKEWRVSSLGRAQGTLVADPTWLAQLPAANPQWPCACSPALMPEPHTYI